MMSVQLLDRLNSEYLALHETYEDLFWTSYMGDHSIDNDFNAAKQALEARKSSPVALDEINKAILASDNEEVKTRLGYWKRFFSLYQTPEHVLELRTKIGELETTILQKKNSYVWSYFDPKSRESIATSKSGLGLMMSSHDDEEVRKACFLGTQAGATLLVKEYIDLVRMRNEYAKALGYKNFYYYKADVEEQMSADTIYNIFDTYYDKTKLCLDNIRELEKSMPGLRKPWNMSYMLSGDFVKQEEKYFELENVILRWGQTFRNIGITYNGAKLQLDLLFRQGKYDNGFCHYPSPIAYIDGNRSSYRCNFTCNAIPGKIGSGRDTEMTLFHEGGHAADRARATMQDICLNTEYPPSSTAWAETQSMFLDTVSSSIEWRMRYAQAHDGSYYPWDLHVEKLKKLHVTRPKWMYHIAMIIDFEKHIYAAETLTEEFILETAKQVAAKYLDYCEETLSILTVPHLYSWESACSYHGYGLATLALTQWRHYFYNKYGYIVDNPKVGDEMKKAWSTGASISFEKHILEATGEKLNPQAYIDEMMMSVDELLQIHQKRIDALASIPKDTSPVNLDAHIALVHGKDIIATNEESFEKMCEIFAQKVSDMASNNS